MELREFSVIDDRLLVEIGRLRVRAWSTETAAAEAMGCWVDEFDRAAIHWAVFDEGTLVAAARLTVHQEVTEVPEAESYADVFRDPPAGPIASLNRLVVDPSTRGLGLSKRLDLVRLQMAEARGCRSAILSTASGPHRVKQLIGWGFEAMGCGSHFRHPPLCYLSAPVVLRCRLPRPSSVGTERSIPISREAPLPV